MLDESPLGPFRHDIRGPESANIVVLVGIVLRAFNVDKEQKTRNGNWCGSIVEESAIKESRLLPLSATITAKDSAPWGQKKQPTRFAGCSLCFCNTVRRWNIDEEIACMCVKKAGKNHQAWPRRVWSQELDSSFAGWIQEHCMHSGLIGRVIVPETRVPDLTPMVSPVRLVPVGLAAFVQLRSFRCDVGWDRSPMVCVSIRMCFSDFGRSKAKFHTLSCSICTLAIA